ncbi:hypothetical protein U9M48_037763 [Paspalum notatum var. saurae]|uniref:Uncharacterized protein n=1 Tax=Paspalum notatum var. saurae TaxID=547442 RepID=A0AAQ3XCR9_PASNO
MAFLVLATVPAHDAASSSSGRRLAGSSPGSPPPRPATFLAGTTRLARACYSTACRRWSHIGAATMGSTTPPPPLAHFHSGRHARRLDPACHQPDHVLGADVIAKKLNAI